MACGTSANGSGRASHAYTPLRLIQPARCVVTATSADAVTIASPSGRRPSAPSTRPNASCVDIAPSYVSSRFVGTLGAAARRGAVQSGGSPRTYAASALAGSKPAHSSPGAPPNASPSSALSPGTPERGLEGAAPPELADAPSVGAKEIAELTRARLWHDAVEALAIHVDDPEDVAAEPRERRLAERLPHVALVELGVAHHDHEALGHTGRAVIDEVARREGAERRHNRAGPHRAGRQVDDVGVLAAARVHL